MEYVVNLHACVGADAANEDLGDRFLSALENHRQVMGPAVGQNTATGILSATFDVEASSADVAAQIARDAFCDALSLIGLGKSPRFTDIHVSEEREEAAAIA